jgi:hypothetical protein
MRFSEWYVSLGFGDVSPLGVGFESIKRVNSGVGSFHTFRARLIYHPCFRPKARPPANPTPKGI